MDEKSIASLANSIGTLSSYLWVDFTIGTIGIFYLSLAGKVFDI